MRAKIFILSVLMIAVLVSSGCVQDEIKPTLNCVYPDMDCATKAYEFMTNCKPSKITSTRDDTYATYNYYVDISVVDETCHFYEKIDVIKKVENLPPNIHIPEFNYGGKTITCNIPLSEFPIENFPIGIDYFWCEGDLVDMYKEMP